MKKTLSLRTYLTVGIILLVLEVVLFTTYWKPTITLFPYRNNVALSSFSDKTETGGNSNIHINHRKNNIDITYVLRPGFEWPFAGVRLRPDGALNLKKYDHLEVIIDIEKAQHAIFTIWTAPEKVGDGTTTEHPIYYGINLHPTKKSYSVEFSSFTTPQWWLAENDVELNDLPANSLSKVTAIDVRSGYEKITEEQRSFTIRGIKLSRDNTLLYLRMLLLLISAGPLLLLIYFIQSRTGKKIVVPLKDIEIDQDRNNPINVVIRVIGETCDDPSLTLYSVAEQAAMSELEVSKSIKKAFGLNFKQYLNQVRLEIAITLLKESNLSIKEIAFKSGYKTTAHFFRVFKSYYNESPKQYQKKVTKSS